MSRIIQFAFLISLFTLNSCSVKNQISTYWQNERDFSSEIYSTTEANYYNAEDQISVKVFNNDKFIDIILETNSTNTLRKIYNLGLSVWIDPEAKFKNSFAINFPMPAKFPFTAEKFENYLSRFSLTELNEEFLDRFQIFEVVNVKKNESLSISTLQEDDTYQVKISSKNEVLFSYHLRIPMSEFYSKNLSGNEIISIGVASINEANEEYHSALSSKEYINKRMERLKAGYNQTPFELTEWWANFKISTE
ncbi:hypothetical protein BZG01_09705 [Labilibaculum manganireducens]|uniref:Uncharacterized protein n=1 Tax=Labilibaculum manganireducens TaxID=1940525 RepID=A0A2N3I939_9BACT|nr:hypothetical protein [Labilibaculum manganireducens]PKQ66795.1 hypothetical protein BZG01_09705 [Labilibaculum manganireducens]